MKDNIIIGLFFGVFASAFIFLMALQQQEAPEQLSMDSLQVYIFDDRKLIKINTVKSMSCRYFVDARYAQTVAVCPTHVDTIIGKLKFTEKVQ